MKKKKSTIFYAEETKVWTDVEVGLFCGELSLKALKCNIVQIT